MAVSKRLRFEILRRDNHTCHYCGRRPPEIELTIDHVVPRALGGTDEAKNLVASCKECNGGKTSIAPDSPLVDAVDADAERWSAAVQAAINKVHADHEAVQEYRSQFLQAWNSYRPPVPLDMVWRNTIDSFYGRGLPIEFLIDAMGYAMSRPKVTLDNKFRYLCGIAWNKVSEIEKHARMIFDNGNATDMHVAPRSSDDPDEVPLGEDALDSFLYGWFIESPDEPPSAAQLSTLAGWVGYAEMAGYGQGSIAQSAWFAAREGSAARLPEILKKCADGVMNVDMGNKEEREIFADIASENQVDPERVAEMWKSVQTNMNQRIAENLGRLRTAASDPWGA